MTPGPGADRPNGAPPYYQGWPAHVWISVARRRRRAAPVAHPDVARQQ